MTPGQDGAPGRLLYVITDLDLGGAEVQVATLATRFAARGWEVRVVSLLDPEALTDRLARAGVAVESLGMRRGVPDPRAVWRLARVYRTFRPDIVHAHMVHGNLLARATRLVAPLPALISTAHNIDEGGRKMDVAYRLTDWASELTTNVSDAGVRRYVAARAVPAHKCLLVVNGVDLSAFGVDAAAGPAERARLRQELGWGDRFTWLAVGRFRKQKDYPNMIRAVAAAGGESRVVLVGDGEEQAGAERLASQLGVSHRVDFLGLRTDVSDLMLAADAYLMSSAWEGLPLVLLEAAASALPIVATDVGGNADVVSGESGLLVPPHDPGALAAAMRQVEATPQAALDEMGAAGRRLAFAKYDVDEVVERWEQLYSRLRGASGGRRRVAFRLTPGPSGG